MHEVMDSVGYTRLVTYKVWCSIEYLVSISYPLDVGMPVIYKYLGVWDCQDDLWFLVIVYKKHILKVSMGYICGDGLMCSVLPTASSIQKK